MKDNLKLETVASTTFPALAEVYRSILEDAGFEVFVVNENAPTYVGLANAVLVQVEASQAEAARKVLESMDTTEFNPDELESKATEEQTGPIKSPSNEFYAGGEEPPQYTPPGRKRISVILVAVLMFLGFCYKGYKLLNTVDKVNKIESRSPRSFISPMEVPSLFLSKCNKYCPMDIDSGGQIVSFQYEGDTVVVKILVEGEAPSALGAIKSNQSIAKENLDYLYKKNCETKSFLKFLCYKHMGIVFNYENADASECWSLPVSAHDVNQIVSSMDNSLPVTTDKTDLPDLNMSKSADNE